MNVFIYMFVGISKEIEGKWFKLWFECFNCDLSCKDLLWYDVGIKDLLNVLFKVRNQLGHENKWA